MNLATKTRDLMSGHELFRLLVYQNLHQRYQGSVLGFLWTLLNPLLVYVSFTVIFSSLNNWDMKDYGLYFFSGYMPWMFFSNACLQASDSVVSNSVLVTRVRVPKALLPMSIVAVNIIDLIASFAILLGLMLAMGVPLPWTLCFVPLSMVCLIVFTAGLCLLFACSTVFLRDFRHLLNAVFFLWFFFSPILWKMPSMPEHVRRWFQLNPLVPYIELFQQPIWAGVAPDPGVAAVSLALGLIVFALGLFVFFRSESRFYYFL